ncbi:MAG: DNA-directed RNA polymerase subunit omega [Calditrichae bacterium]|nr:DNA-directed RNA polymerase subunit omega [Calditrichota bacterium]MCB9059457.1 DNA-directed RNA polymerase subunit omega [Calditrichia bacterium]
MAIQTLDLRKMHEKKLNIYEACLLIAARARQINSERLEEKKENEILSDMDLYDEADIYDRELMEDIKFEKEINPTVIAQDEFFNNKIQAYYIEKTEEQEEA